jgi:hypothetical protein
MLPHEMIVISNVSTREKGRKKERKNNSQRYHLEIKKRAIKKPII